MLMNKKQLETLKKNNEESRDFVRSCIKYALIISIKNDKLRDISITKLCNVAGVSRTAFYRNYKCVEDVLEDSIEVIAREINSKISSDIYENWLAVFTVMEKHYSMINSIVEAGFEHKIYDVFMSLLPKSTENRNIQAIWLSLFYTMTVKWFKEKTPKKIEDAARVAYNYTKDIPLLKV